MLSGSAAESCRRKHKPRKTVDSRQPQRGRRPRPAFEQPDAHSSSTHAKNSKEKRAAFEGKKQLARWIIGFGKSRRRESFRSVDYGERSGIDDGDYDRIVVNKKGKMESRMEIDRLGGDRF